MVGPTTKASDSKTCRENKPRARRAARTTGQLHVPSVLRCRILLFGTPIIRPLRPAAHGFVALVGRQFLWPAAKSEIVLIGLAVIVRRDPTACGGPSTFPPHLHVHNSLHPPCSANKRRAVRARRTATYYYVVHIQCSLCLSERCCNVHGVHHCYNCSAGARSHR